MKWNQPHLVARRRAHVLPQRRQHVEILLAHATSKGLRQMHNEVPHKLSRRLVAEPAHATRPVLVRVARVTLCTGGRARRAGRRHRALVDRLETTRRLSAMVGSITRFVSVYVVCRHLCGGARRVGMRTAVRGRVFALSIAAMRVSVRRVGG